MHILLSLRLNPSMSDLPAQMNGPISHGQSYEITFKAATFGVFFLEILVMSANNKKSIQRTTPDQQTYPPKQRPAKNTHAPA